MLLLRTVRKATHIQEKIFTLIQKGIDSAEYVNALVGINGKRASAQWHRRQRDERRSSIKPYMRDSRRLSLCLGILQNVVAEMTNLIEAITQAICEYDDDELIEQNDYVPYAKAALQAIEDAGYQVVPKELTGEMIDEGANTYHTTRTHLAGRKRVFVPNDWMNAVYKAMLVAAPDVKGE